jgi:hypothetical protein
MPRDADIQITETFRNHDAPQRDNHLINKKSVMTSKKACRTQMEV